MNSLLHVEILYSYCCLTRRGGGRSGLSIYTHLPAETTSPQCNRGLHSPFEVAAIDPWPSPNGRGTCIHSQTPIRNHKRGPNKQKSTHLVAHTNARDYCRADESKRRGNVAVYRRTQCHRDSRCEWGHIALRLGFCSSFLKLCLLSLVGI